MKKLLSFSMMCLMALTMQAQRCAVLDFQVGTGVTEEDIEGISYEFRAKFNPRGYVMLERGQVIRTIRNLGYGATNMTAQQVLKVGRSLDAAVIVVGTMNKFMDEYSVEIRAIDVSSGRTIVSEGANFERVAYRSNMQKVAQSLANKLPYKQGGLSSSTSSYNATQGYTDLGLPSGTLWKNFNATGFYTYDEAVSQFGNRLPTKEQWEELKAECQWSWTGNGYRVTGLNGNSITLPASGYRECSGGVAVSSVGAIGYYWSSTPYDSDYACYLYFFPSRVLVTNYYRCSGNSVRLVYNQ